MRASFNVERARAASRAAARARCFSGCAPLPGPAAAACFTRCGKTFGLGDVSTSTSAWPWLLLIGVAGVSYALLKS